MASEGTAEDMMASEKIAKNKMEYYTEGYKLFQQIGIQYNKLKSKSIEDLKTLITQNPINQNTLYIIYVFLLKNFDNFYSEKIQLSKFIDDNTTKPATKRNLQKILNITTKENLEVIVNSEKFIDIEITDKDPVPVLDSLMQYAIIYSIFYDKDVNTRIMNLYKEIYSTAGEYPTINKEVFELNDILYSLAYDIQYFKKSNSTLEKQPSANIYEEEIPQSVNVEDETKTFDDKESKALRTELLEFEKTEINKLKAWHRTNKTKQNLYNKFAPVYCQSLKEVINKWFEFKFKSINSGEHYIQTDEKYKKFKIDNINQIFIMSTKHKMTGTLGLFLNNISTSNKLITPTILSKLNINSYDAGFGIPKRMTEYFNLK